MEVSGRRQAGSDAEDRASHCDICRLDDKREIAEQFCSDCNEFFCPTCARVHRRSKTSSHHHLLNKDEMPSRKLEFVEENMCSKHKGKMLEYYCKHHSSFCCSVCVTLGHGQCGVDYVDDIAHDFKTSRGYAELIRVKDDVLHGKGTQQTNVKSPNSEEETRIGTKEVSQKYIATKRYPKTIKARFQTKINATHTRDKTFCWLVGSTHVTDNIITVVDFNNNSIKIIDVRTSTVTCYMKLESGPWDITSMDTGRLVVTCKTELLFIRYDGTLSLIRKVPMESGCSAISYSKGKLFVTFVGRNPAVRILDGEGRVLKTIQHNGKGENLFRCPEYIAVSKDGETIYVSDCNTHTITSLNQNGQVCNVYKDNRLSFPCGLTLDSDGNIYVAGCVSDNIHLFTPQCGQVRNILDGEDRIKSPQSVSYNATDSTLCITSNIPNHDFVFVYKLE